MSRARGFFEKIAKRPLEAIEALVASVLFISGVWLVSPFYAPDISTSHNITGSNVIPQILGVIQVAIGFILFYALLNINWPLREKVRGAVTYTVFLLFLFYSFSQMILAGIHRVTWVSTMSLALISGVAHLSLKYKVKVDGHKH